MTPVDACMLAISLVWRNAKDGVVPDRTKPRRDDSVDDSNQRPDLHTVVELLHATEGQLLEPGVRIG